MRIPQLTELPVTKEVTEEFLGYNHNYRTNNGEWYDEKNMTTDYYPLASVRNKRSKQKDSETYYVIANNKSYDIVPKTLGMAYTDGRLITLQPINEESEGDIGCWYNDNGQLVGVDKTGIYYGGNDVIIVADEDSVIDDWEGRKCVCRKWRYDNTAGTASRYYTFLKYVNGSLDSTSRNTFYNSLNHTFYTHDNLKVASYGFYKNGRITTTQNDLNSETATLFMGKVETSGYLMSVSGHTNTRNAPYETVWIEDKTDAKCVANLLEYGYTQAQIDAATAVHSEQECITFYENRLQQILAADATAYTGDGSIVVPYGNAELIDTTTMDSFVDGLVSFVTKHYGETVALNNVLVNSYTVTEDGDLSIDVSYDAVAYQTVCGELSFNHNSTARMYEPQQNDAVTQIVNTYARFFNPTTEKYLTRMGSYIFTAPDGVVYESANNEEDIPVHQVSEIVNVSQEMMVSTVKEDNSKQGFMPIRLDITVDPTEIYEYEEKNIKHYLGDDALWVNQPTCVAMFVPNATGTFNHLNEGDVVKFTYDSLNNGYGESENMTYVDGIFKDQEAKAKIIKKGILDEHSWGWSFTSDTEYILVEGFVCASYRYNDHSVEQCQVKATGMSFERQMPDIKYACESQNRIWCCDKAGHEIYASALGNPYNFYDYSGLATDSYAVNVGTDGEWTGCVNYLGQPLFFKENALHIISGSYPTNQGSFDGGSYAVTTVTDFKGVEKGSERSLVTVDGILYYKAAEGIVAYDGTTTTLVSKAFGNDKYKNAVAGGYNSKYYVSMEDMQGTRHMFVFDTKAGMWSKEDNTDALQFLKISNSLVYLNNADESVYSVTDENILKLPDYQLEGDVEWMCETGTYGYSYPNNKYLSRYQIRLKIAEGARAAVYIQYDSDGVWHKKGDMESKGTRTYLLPIVPIRCDHMKLKFEGKGDVKIISIAKMLEEGGDNG